LAYETLLTVVDGLEQIVSKVVYACEKAASWRRARLRNIGLKEE
jgi:hypothetical protein